MSASWSRLEICQSVNGGGKTGHGAAQESADSGIWNGCWDRAGAPWHARSPNSWRVPRRVGLKGQPGCLASGVGGGFSRAALGEPVAVAIHLEDGDMVGQPVEQRAGEAFGAEGLGPFVEGQVAGDQGSAALVALADPRLRRRRCRTSTACAKISATRSATSSGLSSSPILPVPRARKRSDA